MEKFKKAPEASPSLSKEDLKLNKIKDIMKYLKKGDWASMIGAIIEIFSEGSKKSKEKKEKIKSKTRNGLAQLKKNVEEKKKDGKEKVDENKSNLEDNVDIVPYRSGEVKAEISTKKDLIQKLDSIYSKNKTIFTVNNLHEYFGKNYKRFLIKEDPITKKPLRFLGKLISQGVNIMMLPFLRMAEKKIMDKNINYKPIAKHVLGFQDRNMKFIDNRKSTVPSFHKYGLAVDIDPGLNGPRDGRGTIPDEVILAFAESGFACGLFGYKDFAYLGQDPMHIQLRFPPGSKEGQSLIKSSPVAKKYWKAIQAPLSKMMKSS